MAKSKNIYNRTFINNNCKNGTDWRYTDHASCEKQIL